MKKKEFKEIVVKVSEVAHGRMLRIFLNKSQPWIDLIWLNYNHPLDYHDGIGPKKKHLSKLKQQP